MSYCVNFPIYCSCVISFIITMIITFCPLYTIPVSCIVAYYYFFYPTEWSPGSAFPHGVYIGVSVTLFRNTFRLFPCFYRTLPRKTYCDVTAFFPYYCSCRESYCSVWHLPLFNLRNLITFMIIFITNNARMDMKFLQQLLQNIFYDLFKRRLKRP